MACTARGQGRPLWKVVGMGVEGGEQGSGTAPGLAVAPVPDDEVDGPTGVHPAARGEGTADRGGEGEGRRSPFILRIKTSAIFPIPKTMSEPRSHRCDGRSYLGPQNVIRAYPYFF